MHPKSLRFIPVLPAFIFLLAASCAVTPAGADCCGGRGGEPSFSSGGNGGHGTLQELFGGSSSRPLTLQNTSTTNKVDFQLGGRKTTLAAGESKRRDFGGADASSGAVPQLPGESLAGTLTNSDGNTGSPTPEVKVTEEAKCPPRYADSGTDNRVGLGPVEETTPIPLPATNATTAGSPSVDAAHPEGDPSPKTPAQKDVEDTGHGGGVLSPGAVSLNAAGTTIQKAQPGMMVAASLGASPTRTGRLGYLIPAPTGTGGVYQFHERVSYAVRGVDLASTTYTSGSGTGSVTRIRSVNGLSELTQTDANTLTFKFYATGAFTDSLASGYPPTAATYRTMKVEKLTTGNPDAAKYSIGAKVTIIRPGRADESKTMWWSNSTTVMNAYTAFSSGVTVATSSTIPTDAANPVRTVDTVCTEAFTDASGTSKTLTHRTRDTLRALPDGEDQLEVHTDFLTDNAAAGAPSLTKTYNYWPDSADAQNRRSLRLKVEADGSWEAHGRILYVWPAQNGWRAAQWTDNITLRGWKNQAAPALADIGTPADILTKVKSAGFSGKVTTTDSRGRMAGEVEWANGFPTAQRLEWAKDLVPGYYLANFEYYVGLHHYSDKAYPFCSAITEWAGASGPWFDTITYQVGWSKTSATSTAADSTIPELRHRPQDVYRMKSRTDKYAVPIPTADIDSANVISRTHYRYNTATFSASFPGYTEATSYHNSDAFEIVDMLEDVNHLPTLLHRRVTNRVTGDAISTEKWMVTAVDGSGDPTASAILDRRATGYDPSGRQTSLTANGVLLETWTYPSEYTMTHKDSSGATFITTYTTSGRVLRTVRDDVAAVTFTGGITSSVGGLQSAIFNEYIYTALTGGGSQNALFERTTTTSAHTGNWETAPLVAGGWSRTVKERYDGAGRTVYTKDLSLTENTFTYPTDQAPASVTARFLGSTAGAGGTELEKTTSFLDGRTSERTGSAVIAEYYDYASANYQTTSWRSPTSPATTGTYSTVDPLGRTVESSLSTPAGGFFVSVTTYDVEGNLTSRKLPGAPNDYYEVFKTEYSGANRIVSHALSTDAVYDAADPNQARTLSRYELTGGLWYQMHETQNGSAWLTSSWTRSALGPFDSATLSWNALQWNLVGLTQTYSGGAVRQTASYVEATAGQTLSQTLVDGITQQSTVARAGRALFFQTPRYERTLAYSPLGDALSEPAGDRAQWTNRNITANNGQVASITTPNSAELKESYVYYDGNDKRSGLLKQKTASYSDTSPVTYYSYNDRGQLTHQWGSADYPSRYSYDSMGRMNTLETWRSGAWNTTNWPVEANLPNPTWVPDTTTWTYAGWTSLPNVKTYMPGTGEAATRRSVGYGYHPNGSLATREWQRTQNGNNTGAGITTTYVYDSVSRLKKVDYPDATTMASATPDVEFFYDSAGRVDYRVDGSGAAINTTTYTWTAWGQASKETTVVAGIAGVNQVTAEVERTFDGSNRIDLLKAKWGAGGMIAPTVDYGFDGNGYLSTIATAGRTITMTLAGGAMQWGGLTFATSGTTLMTGTRTLDAAGRTGFISYTQAGTPATMYQSHTYTYDRDRVKKMVREQGYTAEEMAWVYDYDDKGQVKTADKRFSTAGNYTNTSFLAGHQTDYTYDEAGNRLTKKEGGDASTTEGAGQRTSTYTPNALNQYTTIVNEKVNVGGVDKQQFEVTGRRATSTTVIAIASPDSTPVTATAGYQSNNSTGLHYWRKLDNTAPTTPANIGTYENVTVTADGITIDGGLQFLPHPTESPAYDSDGNLRLDTRWNYEWDAENRLTKMTTRHTASPTVPGIRLSYGYDGLSRRLWKKVESTPDGTTWTTANHEAYLYDGWNLLMRVTINGGNATARQSYVWSPDLASAPTGHSSWQSAGGVGGLLLVLDTTGSTTAGDNFFPLMDRIGNVLGYRRANTGSPAKLSAVFEYDAFGRELKSIGEVVTTSPLVTLNPDTLPFRFSTKFIDTESGLLSYGYRYYDPINGRWVDRDPIGERGGVNLNAMVKNSLVAHIDILGMSCQSSGFTFGGESLPADRTFWHMTGGTGEPPGSGADKTGRHGFGRTGQDLLDHLIQLTQACCCIKDLRLAAHCASNGLGSPITGRNGLYGTDVDHEDPANVNARGMNDLRSLMKTGKIQFCPDCVVKIHSCASGEGAFIVALAKETGCTVIGATFGSYPNNSGKVTPFNGDSPRSKWKNEGSWSQSVAGAPLSPIPGVPGGIFDPNQ